MAERRRKVVVFAPMYPPAFLGGGPIRSIHAIVESAPDRYDVLVITRARDLRQDAFLPVEVDCLSTQGRAAVLYLNTRRLASLRIAWRTIRSFEPDVAYLNSFFDFPFSIVPQVLLDTVCRRALVTVVAVRGEFAPQALALEAYKKRPFLALFRLTGALRRKVWHATSEEEREDIRRVVGRRQQDFLWLDRGQADRTERVTSGSSDVGPLKCVTLGRIVPIKGIRELLQSLVTVESQVELSIIGPEEDAAYASECRKLAALIPSNVTVNFVGPLAPAEVSRMVSQHDLMIVPSRRESFGHIVAEALSVGVPVLIQDVTPWTATIREGGGRIVAEDRWAEAVDAYAAESAAIRDAARLAAARAFDDWEASGPGGHLFDQFWLVSEGAH